MRFPRESYIRRLSDVADELLTWAQEYQRRYVSMPHHWKSRELVERASVRSRECREIAHAIEELYTRLYKLR